MALLLRQLCEGKWPDCACPFLYGTHNQTKPRFALNILTPRWLVTCKVLDYRKMGKHSSLYLWSGLSIRCYQNAELAHFVYHQYRTHIVILSNYLINISELYIMPLPGWHDYRPAFNSLNRPRFHCWAEWQSDWMRRVLPRPRYSSRAPLETVKQCRRDGLCLGHGDRSLMNIVPKQETLSDFLWHTTTKN